MNAQKFTQKSLEAIQNAQSIAISAQSQQIEQVHLFMALVSQEGGLIGQMMQKLGVDANALRQTLQSTIDSMPAVTGSGREPDKVYVSRDVDVALTAAEQLAAKMKDEYVSVEHIALCLIEKPDSRLQKILDQYHITKDAFLQALVQVRGNTRVTSEKPGGHLRRPHEIWLRPDRACAEKQA